MHSLSLELHDPACWTVLCRLSQIGVGARLVQAIIICHFQQEHCWPSPNVVVMLRFSGAAFIKPLLVNETASFNLDILYRTRRPVCVPEAIQAFNADLYRLCVAG
jgi:hypothetical protein